ncbi:MAG TPA: RluA family pseudouridine synthase [Edaphocola sp.]|nr:RluA family pseudouridine synthase [Edaphocola sp.]
MSVSDWEDEADIDDIEEGEVQPEMVERARFVVDKGQEPIRIDKYIMVRVEGATRNKVQQAIDENYVLVDGKPVKSNLKVKPGMAVVYYDNRRPERTDIIPEPMDLNIVYEDEDILVVNKPAGMVVHPGCGNYSGTLVNGVAWYLNPDQDKEKIIDLPRVGLIHRIDKDTSGLLLLGKNEESIRKLYIQFQDRSIHRRYIALAWGNVEDNEGVITGNIGRNIRFRKKMDVFPDGDFGKHAVTHYKVLERFHYVTLLEYRLETGRTHQIRVHSQHIGHPLFNDPTYGGDRIIKGTVYAKYKQFIENCFKILPRQALHAKELGFVHPRTGEMMHFESEVPDDIQTVIDRWRRYIGSDVSLDRI